jgi:hypothetical protein
MSQQYDDQRKQESFGAAGIDAPVSAQTLKALAAIRACKTRAILTDEQAIRIYQIKLDSQTASISVEDRTLNFRAGVVARAFGVSDKAIRDIWKGRTWLRETMHLDPARAAMAGALRPPGRPKGRTTRATRPMPAPRRAATANSQSDTLPLGDSEEKREGWARSIAKVELGQERAAFCVFEQVVVLAIVKGEEEEADRDPAQTTARSPRPDHRVWSSPSFVGGILPKTVTSESCFLPPPAASRQDLSDARFRAAAAAVVAAAAATAVSAALAATFTAALLHGAATGLPASSQGDDPFHDDWTQW